MSDGDQQASSNSNANSGVSQRNSPNSPNTAKARTSPASNASAMNTSTSPENDNDAAAGGSSGASTSPASAAMREQQLLSAHYIASSGGGLSSVSSAGAGALATPGTFIVWIHNVSPTQRYTVMRPNRNSTAQEVLEQVLERTYQLRTPNANDFLLVVERLVSTALEKKRRHKKSRSKSAHQQQQKSATAFFKGFLKGSLSPSSRRSIESEETTKPKSSLLSKPFGEKQAEPPADEPVYEIRSIIHRNEVLFDVAKNLPQASRIAMRKVTELLCTRAGKSMSDMDVRGLQSASCECILSLGESALSRPRPSITTSDAACGSGNGSGSGSVCGFDMRRCSTTSEPNRPRSKRPSYLYSAQAQLHAIEHSLVVPPSHPSASGRKRSSTTERGANSTSSGGHSAITSPECLSLPQSRQHTARSSPSTPASGTAGTATGTGTGTSPRSHKTSACTCAGTLSVAITEQKRGSQSEENLQSNRISPPDCTVHLGPSRPVMTTTSELPPHPIRQRANTASGSSIREILLHNLRRALPESPPSVQTQTVGASSDYAAACSKPYRKVAVQSTSLRATRSTTAEHSQSGRQSRSSPEEAAAARAGSQPGSRNSTVSGSSSSGQQRATHQQRPHKLSVPVTLKRLFKGNKHHES